MDNEKLTYMDLVDRFGEIEAIQTLQALEAVAFMYASMDRLQLSPQDRFEDAMQRIIATDYAT